MSGNLHIVIPVLITQSCETSVKQGILSMLEITIKYSTV